MERSGMGPACSASRVPAALFPAFLVACRKGKPASSVEAGWQEQQSAVQTLQTLQITKYNIGRWLAEPARAARVSTAWCLRLRLAVRVHLPQLGKFQGQRAALTWKTSIPSGPGQ
jgi:hypothetical protein